MKIPAPRYILVFVLSYTSLLLERLWNRLWPVTSLTLFFISLSLVNIPIIFGAVWHLLFLAIFAVALIATFLRAGTHFSLPTRKAVERRMEKTGGLSHRPLETLHDSPAKKLPKEAMSLWQKHIQKTAEAIGKIKIYWPRPNVSTNDRWALRYTAVIFLVTGLVIAGEDATLRMQQALTPDIESLLNKKTATLDLWITPPEYTRAATIFLSTAGQGIVARDGAVQVPEGSLLKFRLSGYNHSPKLKYAGKPCTLTEATPENFTFEMPLHKSGNLNLTSWLRHTERWPIIVASDTIPDITIIGTETTQRSAVKIIYSANDDHGIVKLTGIIETLEDSKKPYNRNSRFNIPLTQSSGKASHLEGLTAHPLAGLPVILTMEAEDGIGQKNSSTPYTFTLPERVFTNPIAKRVIEERKSLLWTKNILSRRAIAANLSEIAAEIAFYKGDIVVFLSISTSARRLIHYSGDKTAENVQSLLWDIALRLEDGGLSFAQLELRDALQKMSQALNDENIPKQQLQDILDDVQEKMHQYVQALSNVLQQRLKQGKKLPVLSPTLAQKFIKNIDLNKMLKQMQAMAQANSREEMQKMVDNLKDSLDGINMKKFDQMQEKQMQAMAALQNLEEIIHRQQALFDKTNKTKDPANADKQGKEQFTIRQKLGSSMRMLEKTMKETIPDNFAKAYQSMKLSEDALSKSMPKESLPHQKTALDELQKGLDDTVKQMAQSMQQSILSFGMMPNIGNYGADYDPLGRQNSRAGDDDIKIPSKKERRHVQEIIEELRRRSNEPNRAKTERDYIDRLLDQF